ncbi:MAG: PrpF family protein [Rhodospirillales bacterium]|nr:PrpF family protein [Rhodospirillales bacterium]MDE2576859.1 PrpF family protein [Rhodospirillales bacterium]
MTQRSIPAVFMRGGTSKAVMFHRRDLPAERAAWDEIFLAAMGSPDPQGRQLDGMGGGVSSLSKVCVLAPSDRPDADIDYTFAQVLIREPRVDYRSNCGNMSSAVGPFAVDEGLVAAAGEAARVRIFNTNTHKLIHATFPVRQGRARYGGDLAIPGVSGTGAPIRLDFLNPGGATTGRLLPTGQVLDRLDVPGLGPIAVSLVDAANACAFVRAGDLGLTGRELPDEIEARPDILARLAAIRIQASLAMGIAASEEEARDSTAVPYIGFVAPAADAMALSGEAVPATAIDVMARIVSNGQPHRALPITASLCIAVAARLAGSLVAQALGGAVPGERLRIGMPSGVLTVGADVGHDASGAWEARSGSFYRTARRLFDGRVYLPEVAP